MQALKQFPAQLPAGPGVPVPQERASGAIFLQSEGPACPATRSLPGPITGPRPGCCSSHLVLSELRAVSNLAQSSVLLFLPRTQGSPSNQHTAVHPVELKNQTEVKT